MMTVMVMIIRMRTVMIIIDGHHHLFLVLIRISKVTLDSIGNAEDATMIVIITALTLIIIISY